MYTQAGAYQRTVRLVPRAAEELSRGSDTVTV
jgi:hypothetical protein